MSERTRPRVARLLGIVAYLEDNGPTPFAELAAHFGVSESQIAKDIGQLWIVGRPGGFANDLIDFDADSFDEGIAAITNTQGATQVRLAPREGVALVAALSAIKGSGLAPRAAESALEKISAALGEGTVEVVHWPDQETDVTATLARAIASGRVVEIDYVDASDRRSTREVEPHRIVTIDGDSYLECYCRRANDYRTLRVERITGATVTDEAVVTPASDTEGFALKPAYEAKVTMQRRGRWAIEDIPGVTIEDDGETVVATFGVSNERWFASRLLTVAPALQEIEPVELRDAVTRQAVAVLAAHRE